MWWSSASSRCAEGWGRAWEQGVGPAASQARAPQDLQDRDVATFLGLAQDALDMTFGLTDRPQLFQTFGLTKDTVVLFKKVGQVGSGRSQGGGAGSH